MHRQLRLISTTDLDFFLYEYNWNRFGHFCLKGLSWCFEFAFSNLISDFWWTHFVPCLRSFLGFFFMCWFVMPITGCTVSFHCSFLFVHFWFLPCDLCNTCCGVPCLKLKDDVDLTCKYCIKKKEKKKQCVKHAEVCEMTNRTEWKSCSKTLSWWMLSEIFFYILKSSEKKDKNTKWEKAVGTLQRECFY